MDDKQESVGEGTNLIENKILNYKTTLSINTTATNTGPKICVAGMHVCQ